MLRSKFLPPNCFFPLLYSSNWCRGAALRLSKGYTDLEIVISALVEGVVRAGNGFAQYVGEEEKLDQNVIRMLRGAPTPGYSPLIMEIQYQKDDDDEDQFVRVERVSDSLRVLGLDEDEWSDAQLGDEPALFAETRVAGRKGIETPDADGQARYDHLPALPVPKLVQTPQYVPLYPVTRTHVYILMSPDAAQGIIKSVVLKGDSAENPFKLEVPVEVLSECGETIHQLTAKKAVGELEEGRGSLVYAEDGKGVLLKEKHSVRFQSMVEREAVRLGIQYQIAGKFTSFIAPEIKSETPGKAVFWSIAAEVNGDDSGDKDMGFGLDFEADAETEEVDFQAQGGPVGAGMEDNAKEQEEVGGEEMEAEVEETDPLQKIIALQTFEGCWSLNVRLLEAVGLLAQHQAPQEADPKVWATMLAITFLEVKMSGDKEAWVMIVEKAGGWLKNMGEGEDWVSEEKWTLAKQLILGAE